MAIPARWIRIDAEGERDWRAACAGFARACAGFARAQRPRSAPAVLWTRAGSDLALAVVAPLKFAPGHRKRWSSWGLAPLIATFRQAGLRAYLEDNGIWLSGRCIASGQAAAVGACVVVAATFAPPVGQFLEKLRERIESQHGWQFDHCWPSTAEKEAIGEAMAVNAR